MLFRLCGLTAVNDDFYAWFFVAWFFEHLKRVKENSYHDPKHSLATTSSITMFKMIFFLFCYQSKHEEDCKWSREVALTNTDERKQ